MADFNDSSNFKIGSDGEIYLNGPTNSYLDKLKSSTKLDDYIGNNYKYQLIPTDYVKEEKSVKDIKKINYETSEFEMSVNIPFNKKRQKQNYKKARNTKKKLMKQRLVKDKLNSINEEFVDYYFGKNKNVEIDFLNDYYNDDCDISVWEPPDNFWQTFDENDHNPFDDYNSFYSNQYCPGCGDFNNCFCSDYEYPGNEYDRLLFYSKQYCRVCGSHDCFCNDNDPYW